MLTLPRLFIFALALLLSACTTYEYLPPASDAGRQCVTACDTNRQICIAGKEQSAAMQNQMCETRRAAQLSSCLRMAITPQARAYCDKTVPACTFHSAQSGTCESAYRSCYTQCGGRIVEHKN